MDWAAYPEKFATHVIDRNYVLFKLLLFFASPLFISDSVFTFDPTHDPIKEGCLYTFLCHVLLTSCDLLSIGVLLCLLLSLRLLVVNLQFGLVAHANIIKLIINHPS